MVRTSTLLLNAKGNFAISIIDNLIIVHHQESKVRVSLGGGWGEEAGAGGIIGMSLIPSSDSLV